MRLRFNSRRFTSRVSKQLQKQTFREMEQDAQVPVATLYRIAHGGAVKLGTFLRLCEYLDTHPMEYIEVDE